jgi:hypothetical protein
VINDDDHGRTPSIAKFRMRAQANIADAFANLGIEFFRVSKARLVGVVDGPHVSGQTSRS